jgi:transposase InsO family protein
MAVGFILSQIDENGKRRPARYGSLPLNERESRYSQPKLELYGLYRALHHWRMHLIGVQTLHVEVDAKYIKGMLKEPDLHPNAAINRWILGILMYDFKLIHVPGHKFRGPDALSRRPMAEDEEIIEDDDEWLEDMVLQITDSSPYVSLFTTASSPAVKGLQPPQVLATRVDQTQSILEVLKFLMSKKIPEFATPQETHRFLQKTAKFFIKDNKMFKHNQSGYPLAVVLRESDRQLILKQAHDDLGHRGERAVFQTLRLRFYWPHLQADVRRYVRSCHQCQIRSLKRYHIPVTVSAPTILFSKIYMDIMKMPKTTSGYNAIVAARDDLSGACEARAIQDGKSQTVADFFWEQIICRYGAVRQVTTDNGPENQAKFKKMVIDLGIPHIKISKYNSQANGLVERGHFTLREALVKSCEGNIDEWPQKLHHVLFADRITTSSVTGYSPYYLLYGTHPLLPFDITEATFMIEEYRAGLTTEELLTLRVRQLSKKPADIRRAARMLKKHRFASKEQFEKRYAKLLTREDYEPGELVLMRNSAIESSLDRKAKARYLGPFIVERRTETGAYVLQELDGTTLASHVAAYRLGPYIARDQKTLARLARYNPDVSEALAEELLQQLTDEHGEHLENKARPSKRKRQRKSRAKEKHVHFPDEDTDDQ